MANDMRGVNVYKEDAGIESCGNSGLGFPTPNSRMRMRRKRNVMNLKPIKIFSKNMNVLISLKAIFIIYVLVYKINTKFTNELHNKSNLLF